VSLIAKIVTAPPRARVGDLLVGLTDPHRSPGELEY